MDSRIDMEKEGTAMQALLGGESNGDTPWRLNANSFRLPEHLHPESPKTAAADCMKKFTGEKGIDEYYRQQEEMLESFVEMDSIAERGYRLSTTEEERDNIKRGENFAIQISNVMNLVIFAAKVYACVRSGSLAIIASTLDSLLDLLSGFILWFTAISMRKQNPYLYPIGKKRMQPLGILVFASVMATLGLQIILESVRTLITQEHSLALNESRNWVVGIMLGTTVVKFMLMVYCRTFSDEIVRAYAQDHFFDVMTNMIGLIAAVLASIFSWWLDPAGAIVLALYTMRTWSLTVLENVNALVSRTASPDFLRKLTYLCWNHHKEIRQIDTVRAYTFGSHYFAEVDIVLAADMPLRQAHDIGESLQDKLESLPEIERAFVHLDYEVTHRPEHAYKD
jgi:cation diffusion facilitator family transporter